jgi:hypothetical protein
MLWITLPRSDKPLRRLAQLVLLASLGFALSACGSKRSMEGARSDEELGSVYDNEATRIEGYEEEAYDEPVSFDEPRISQSRRAAAVKGGSTRGGSGRVDSVTTKDGETLWQIAERKEVYGSGWLYPLIYKANRQLIKDPTRLEAGLQLKIPRDVPDPEVEIAKEEAMTGQFLDRSAPVAELAPTPEAGAQAGPAPKSEGRGWLLWLLALAGAAGGSAWWWRRRRKEDPSAE